MGVLIQKSPNRWSCLPTSFAMAADIPLSELLAEIGHDGSEIVDPGKPDPLCRRCFHPEEIKDVLWHRGLIVSTFEAFPSFRYGPIWSEQMAYERAIGILKYGCNVIAGVTKEGARHAVAVIRNEVYCPNAGHLPNGLDDFGIEWIYRITRFC